MDPTFLVYQMCRGHASNYSPRLLQYIGVDLHKAFFQACSLDVCLDSRGPFIEVFAFAATYDLYRKRPLDQK